MPDASEVKVVREPRTILVEYRNSSGKPKKTSGQINASHHFFIKRTTSQATPALGFMELPKLALPVPTGPKPSQTEIAKQKVTSDEADVVQDDRRQEPRASVLEFGRDVDLASVYNAATSWNGGEGMFLSWHDKVAGPLLLAYRLYLKLIAGGDGAKALILSDNYFRSRRRQPGRTPNLALMAIQVVTKPGNESDRTICSQYADYLKLAVARNYHPDEFAERMNAVTLGEVRKEKRIGTKPRIRNSKSVPSAANSETIPSSDAASDAASLMLPAKVYDESGQLTGKFETLANVRLTLDGAGTWIIEILSTAMPSEAPGAPGETA